MLSKLIRHAATREEARQRAITALRDYAIRGIRTNIPFLMQVLAHPQFIDVSIDTEFLDREGAAIAANIPQELPDAASKVIEALRKNLVPRQNDARGTAGTVGTDPFETLRGWRG